MGVTAITAIDVMSNEGFFLYIHLIPKWRPINYSFVCMLISPLCLILTSKFFWFFIHFDEAKRACKQKNNLLAPILE